jgi:hypothetical protein
MIEQLKSTILVFQRLAVKFLLLSIALQNLLMNGFVGYAEITKAILKSPLSCAKGQLCMHYNNMILLLVILLTLHICQIP